MKKQDTEFVSWAESFTVASLPVKRMILSKLIERIDVGSGYDIHIKFKPTAEEFAHPAARAGIAARLRTGLFCRRKQASCPQRRVISHLRHREPFMITDKIKPNDLFADHETGQDKPTGRDQTQ